MVSTHQSKPQLPASMLFLFGESQIAPMVRSGTNRASSASEIVLRLGTTDHVRGATFPDRKTLKCQPSRNDLDAEESGRLARFVHVEDRMNYLAAHAGARLLLGAIAERDAGGLRFEQSTLGKPVLAELPKISDSV